MFPHEPHVFHGKLIKLEQEARRENWKWGLVNLCDC